MRRLRLFAALVGAAALAGCGDANYQQITGSLPASRVKFFNFAVNGPGVNFYANTAKITAIAASTCQGSTDPACLTTGLESTSGVAYGAAGNGAFYSAIDPGQYTFAGKIAAATDKDLAIASVTSTLENGKAYSVYLSGFYDATTKKADAFVLEDAFSPTIDFNVVSIRFVNAIGNAQPMKLYIRIPSTGKETAIGAAVGYKSGTTFVNLDANDVNIFGTNESSWDFVVRSADGATILFTRTAVGLSRGRVYTMTARGDMTVTSTTAATRPILDVTANR